MRADGTGDADVAIVGSALSGLVAGAILARHGRQVVVLEHADTAGGRGGSVEHDGYWIDFGHRDGHDVGDCQLAWHHGEEAAREAGVTVHLRRVERPLRLHRMPDGPVVDGTWGAGGFLAAARAMFECPDDGVPELERVLGALVRCPAGELAALRPERLGPWLGRTVAHPGVRRAVLLMATVIFHRHPAEASVGRFAEFLRRPRAGPYIADHPDVGGMQGLVEPFARAVRERGGELALGWKPVEIVVESGRVRAVVAVDRANLVREVRAPVVVATYPVWEVLDLLDPAAVPEALRRGAEALRAHRADLVGWQAGLVRLPRLRASGEVEAHDGWNRLLAGAERSYRGGWQITSLASRRAAPPGRHLLSLVMVRWFRGGASAGQPWPAARAELDEAIAYLGRFYADLDACVAWARYQYVTAPQSMSWAWAPVDRHGLEAPGLRGLLLAGSTLEAPAGVVDVGAYAGLHAARRAVALLADG